VVIMQSETNKAETEIPQKPLGVSGLNGWLVLVQIGIYATLLLSLIRFFNEYLSVLDPEVWSLLTSKDSEFYHPLWGPTIIFEMAVLIIMFVFCLYILFNFYSKKAILPKLMIIFYAGSLAARVIDYILVQLIPVANEIGDGVALRSLIQGVVVCLIWIPYFLKSERVKNTFIN